MRLCPSVHESLTCAIDEAATEFVFLTDTTPPEDGGPLIAYMNQAMLRAFGYEKHDVIGKSPKMFWGPETDETLVLRLRSNIAHLHDSGGEFAAYRRDGSAIWVRFRGRVYERDGEPLHWIAIGSDITESRRQVQRIKELLQFRSDLITMLAHDFRGPLTAVSGFAELLLEARSGELTEADRIEMLRTIRREAQRLANFAADTLTVSRMETEKLSISPQRFDLVALLREIADLYSERGIVALHVPASLELEADRSRMRQVFDNLIGNAVKYSMQHTAVVIDCVVDGDDVVIQVSDTGMGIPPEDLHTIFERYARASNARAKRIPGTGFGLYLARAIVEHHGGHITVSSTLGAGSVFTVRVPQRAAVPRLTLTESASSR